jgi:hypothetical protein
MSDDTRPTSGFAIFIDDFGDEVAVNPHFVTCVETLTEGSAQDDWTTYIRTSDGMAWYVSESVRDAVAKLDAAR